MPTLSRMRFSTEQLPFIERYFCVRTNSLSVMATGTRIIPFLHQFARPVLFCVKANCSLSRCAVSARTPLHVPAAGWTYPRVFIVCCWFSIRGLELFNAPDRPYCWCCVIHRLLISCRSPLPLLFLLRFKSSLTSSATCKPSTLKTDTVKMCRVCLSVSFCLSVSHTLPLVLSPFLKERTDGVFVCVCECQYECANVSVSPSLWTHAHTRTHTHTPWHTHWTDLWWQEFPQE